MTGAKKKLSPGSLDIPIFNRQAAKTQSHLLEFIVPRDGFSKVVVLEV